MERNRMKRYLVFLAALLVCAGLAWYTASDRGAPQDNAVLALLDGEWTDGGTVYA